MTNLNFNAATRWGINVLLLLSGVLALYLARSILIPAVIALLLAALLWAPANWLHRKLHLPWSVACSIVFGILVVLALIVPVGFGLPIPKLLQGLPTTPELQEEAYGKFRIRLKEAISPIPLDKDYFPEKAEDSKAAPCHQASTRSPKIRTSYPACGNFCSTAGAGFGNGFSSCLSFSSCFWKGGCWSGAWWKSSVPVRNPKPRRSMRVKGHG